MTTKKKSTKIGVSQLSKVVRPGTLSGGVLAKAKPMFDPKILRKNTKPTQSELFVRSRNPVFQYAVDVFALAFVLAIIFMFVERLVK